MNTKLRPVYSSTNILPMETNVEKEIAAAIDAAMRSYDHGRGISQAALSRLSGVPQPTISRTLKGRSTPETSTLSRLIEVLGVGSVEIKPSVAALLSNVGTDKTNAAKRFPATTKRGRRIAEIVSILHKINDDGLMHVLGRVEDAAHRYPMATKKTAS